MIKRNYYCIIENPVIHKPNGEVFTHDDEEEEVVGGKRRISNTSSTVTSKDMAILAYGTVEVRDSSHSPFVLYPGEIVKEVR